MTAAEPIEPGIAGGLAALGLEVLVREHLEKVFGWVSLDSVMFALPKGEHDEDDVERLLFALAERNVVRLTIRPGKSPLVSLVKPGYEPTAEVRPDPPPRPAPRRTIVRPPQLSPAKPTPPPPETQPMSSLTKAEHILEILAKGPRTTNQIAKALDSNDAAVGFHLCNLARAKKVCKPDGRMGPWALAGAQTSLTDAAAKGRSSPVPQLTARAKVTGNRTIEDLDLKLKTLDGHIEVAKTSGRSISAFILSEIRADLARLAGAA